MKKIQLFLKYLVLMLFLTVWIIIMFFTDYMNSQSVKLYCRKSNSINTYSNCFHQIIMFLIKKSKYVTGFSVAYFFVVFLSIYVRI